MQQENSNIWPLSDNASLPPDPCLQTSYPPSAHLHLLPLPSHHCSLLLAVLLCLLTLSEFFNGMMEVFKPEVLKCYNFFPPTPLTLSVSRNPILTHLPLSKFLDSPLCFLIAHFPNLAFSFLMPHMLATASSFLSGRDYPFLNFLSLSLGLIPTLIM